MIMTTTIPYVNARPHLGFLLELVQADVLARHHRRRGATGAAADRHRRQLAQERPRRRGRRRADAELVDRNAAAFAALHEPYSLSLRRRRPHQQRPPAPRRRRAALAGLRARPLPQALRGRYCVGCEQFYTDAELDATATAPSTTCHRERVVEENWFFRLSRYADPLREAIEARPAAHRARASAATRCSRFLAGGLDDISVSRRTARARGWGIPVPGDPDQVVYVWWDALGNYVTAPAGEAALARRPRPRIHLLGKGVLRFHAVYWPAMLLSAGLPLPTDLVVHDYLTVDGRKISKSGAAAVDPVALADGSAPTPSAGGCCATCRGSATPTSPSSGWSRAPTTSSPTASATSSTGSPRWSTATATASCRRAAPSLPSITGRSTPRSAAFDFRRATDVVWDIRHARQPVRERHPAVDAGRRAGTRRRAGHAGPRRAARSRTSSRRSCPPPRPAIAERLPATGRLPVPVPLFGRFDLATTRPIGLA